uniref:cytidine deaminase n=1 Tax=Rhizophora mucronata TaxID=61149 RepID=A0A2P2J0D5_RHIMU
MEQPRFVIEAAESESMAKESGLTVFQFLPSLVKSAKALAHPPISKYPVGAVALGSSGRIFFGANLEFPALPLHHSVHAEQFLITNLALNAEPNLNYMAVSSAPCGHCRQFFQEIRNASDIKILIMDDGSKNSAANNGGLIHNNGGNDGSNEFQSFSHLLPHRFGPDDLLDKDVPLVLEPHHNHLSFLSPPNGKNNVLPNGLNSVCDDLKDEALDAANKSHAPYSECPSGLALMDCEGKVYSGSYIESAAYNPSLGPVQAALVAYLVRGGGGDYGRIVAATLVEKEGAAVRQECTARLLLQEISPKCEFKVFHCSSSLNGCKKK